MSTDVPVLGLADIQFVATDQDDVSVMRLRDTKGKFRAYLINPDGLGVVLQRVLQLASEWSDHPDLAPETVTRDPDGSTNALAAKDMRILPGRDAKECVVEVLVGRVEMSFFVSLDKVIAAAANLVKIIEPDRPMH